MRTTDLLFCETCKKELVLTHQCITENGFLTNDIFKIKELIPNDAEEVEAGEEIVQVVIIDQVGRLTTINPNQIEGYEQ